MSGSGGTLEPAVLLGTNTVNVSCDGPRKTSKVQKKRKAVATSEKVGQEGNISCAPESKTMGRRPVISFRGRPAIRTASQELHRLPPDFPARPLQRGIPPGSPKEGTHHLSVRPWTQQRTSEPEGCGRTSGSARSPEGPPANLFKKKKPPQKKRKPNGTPSHTRERKEAEVKQKAGTSHKPDAKVSMPYLHGHEDDNLKLSDVRVARGLKESCGPLDRSVRTHTENGQKSEKQISTNLERTPRTPKGALENSRGMATNAGLGP